MWGLGCLVWESFNGPLRSRGNLKDIENVSKFNSFAILFKQFIYDCHICSILFVQRFQNH